MSATAIAQPVGAEADVEPRGRRRLVLLVVVTLLLGAAGGGYVLLFGAESEAPDVDGEIVTVEPMTTTVGEANLHHARVAMGVVLVHGQAPEAIEPRIPLLKDALLRELAQMDAAQVRSADGSDALRRALTNDAQQIWGEDVVRRVVLTELMIN